MLGTSARKDATDRLENATSVLKLWEYRIRNPEEVLEHAKCIAVAT